MGRVARLGDDVEIAGQNQRLLVFDQLARVRDEPVHESELIGVFLGAGRIAVRQIDAGDPHDAFRCWDHRLDVTRLDVRLVARQAAGDLERTLGENGDAVEGLLPVRLDVVAERLDLEARKGLVEALDLLQTQRVGCDLSQIIEQVRKPLADGIDVPGRDAQGAAPSCGGPAQSDTLRKARGGRGFEARVKWGPKTARWDVSIARIPPCGRELVWASLARSGRAREVLDRVPLTPNVGVWRGGGNRVMR